MTDIHYLLCSALLNWIMLVTASLVRARAWTGRGLLLVFGNRAEMPAPTPLAGRADRAARNMLESMVIFVAVLFAGHAAQVQPEILARGAGTFFWARLLYWPIYVFGISYLRTLLWTVALTGLSLIGRATLAEFSLQSPRASAEPCQGAECSPVATRTVAQQRAAADCPSM